MSFPYLCKDCLHLESFLAKDHHIASLGRIEQGYDKKKHNKTKVKKIDSYVMNTESKASLLAIAFDPILTSTLIRDIGLHVVSREFTCNVILDYERDKLHSFR